MEFQLLPEFTGPPTTSKLNTTQKQSIRVVTVDATKD